MGRLFKQYLNGKRIYSCSNCRCHTSDHDEIISKAFQGRHGRAYLFSNVVNITLGPREDRLLITGLHTVSDIYCSCCQQVLGWKYVRALLPLPLCPAPPCPGASQEGDTRGPRTSQRDAEAGAGWGFRPAGVRELTRGGGSTLAGASF